MNSWPTIDIYMCKTKFSPYDSSSTKRGKRSPAETQRKIPDKLLLFSDKDRIINFEDLKKNLHTVDFNGLAYNLADGFIIQSTDFLSGTSVPRFLLHIFNDFHCGVRCSIRSF